MIEALTDILLRSNPSESIIFDSSLFWLLLVVFLPIYGVLYRRRSAMALFTVAFGCYLYYKTSGAAVLLLLGRAAVDYVLSKMLERQQSRTLRRFTLIFSLLLSIGALAYFKYAGFATTIFNDLTGSNFQMSSLMVPIGISFYTFRSISYMVEVYRRTLAVPKNPVDYLFYLSFFPALVAGPIVRPEAFFMQIRSTCRVGEQEIYSGLWIVMRGAFKKFVVADYLAQFNDVVFANPMGYDGVECLLAAFGYGVQIYFDFSGYSDMAIGLSRSMGFDLGENFHAPYKSRNLSDFWRRWHISLSSWLRDYIYIPLGGNRKGTTRMTVNVLVTMLVGGIWHGAGWTFLIWGCAHGIGLILNKLVGKWMPKSRRSKLNGLVYGMITFLFVNMLWILFRSPDLEIAQLMMENICLHANFGILPVFWHERALWCVMLVFAYILIFMPNAIVQKAEQLFVRANWIVKFVLFCLLVQCILALKGTQVVPFIYTQF